MKPYRVFCLTLAIGFAAVGIIFGTMPDEVIAFFNNLSKPLSFPPCPETGFNFYLILAVAYMYIVTVLAVMMYRFPGSKSFPILLVNAKLASSIMSFGLFLFHSRQLGKPYVQASSLDSCFSHRTLPLTRSPACMHSGKVSV